MKSDTGIDAGIAADPEVALHTDGWEQYQPGGRFWAFQGIETGIFLALAVVLVVVAVRRLRQIA